MRAAATSRSVSPAEGDMVKVLVITNDSTVFLNEGVCAAKDMFGGRVTEVRNFCERISDICDVSFGIISGRFGFVPGEYMVMPYREVTDTPETYLELQERKDYASVISYVSRPYDMTAVFVPKAMMAILLDNDALHGNVTAVTSEAFREHFEINGWNWYKRSGARIGNANADDICRLLKAMAEEEERKQ